LGFLDIYSVIEIAQVENEKWKKYEKRIKKRAKVRFCLLKYPTDELVKICLLACVYYVALNISKLKR
jgi:hypothetical protein